MKHARLSTALTIILFVAVIVSQARAHPDLEEQIARLTADLGEQGSDPELHLKRADFYRRHAQYEEALRDIAITEKLKPGTSAVLLARARVFSESGRSEEALETVEQFLGVEENHYEGLIIRARCLARLNHEEEAIRIFSSGIAKSPAPGPDVYLERAQVQARLKRLDSAISGLDEGMARLGELPALQLPAIEYERQRKTFDTALARVDKIIAKYPVKEPWLTLRAEILEQAGRQKEAREAFKLVIAGIEKYPSTRRTLDFTKQLETRACNGLIRTEIPHSAQSAQVSQP